MGAKRARARAPVAALGADGRSLRFGAAAACAALALLYAALSYTAVRTKSAIYDEPMHVLAAWTRLHTGDFRINIEDPPLWQYWAAIPNGTGALNANWNDPAWRQMPDNQFTQWRFAIDTLFRTPANDGAAFLHRSRTMMVVVGVVLCLLVAAWSWQLAGPAAAVVSTALVSFDPNLIGHGGLVKNDVAMALAMTAVSFTAWRLGRQVTMTNALCLVLVTAAGVNTKFSAVLLPLIAGVLLGVRAVAGGPWLVSGRLLTGRGARIVAAVAVMLAVGVGTYVGIWACYRFRFDPSSTPGVRLNTAAQRYQIVLARYGVEQDARRSPPPVVPSERRLSPELLSAFEAQSGRLSAALTELRSAEPAARLSQDARQLVQRFLAEASQAEAAAISLALAGRAALARGGARDDTTSGEALSLGARLHGAYATIRDVESRGRFYVYLAHVGDEAPDAFVRLVNFFLEHRLLPSAFLHGLLYVHGHSMRRSAFLLGDISTTGWWYYFPLAMAFKTPVPTLSALGLAAILGFSILTTRRKEATGDERRAADAPGWWPAACLGLPVVIYMASAMSSSLNLGVRHVLGVYPFFYVAAGTCVPWALARRPRVTIAAAGALLLMLGLGTFRAWPSYIAYFNDAAGGSRGGLRLLGDSNLDWGQDLLLLRDWQRQTGNTPIALAYFGTADEEGRNDALPSFYGVDVVRLPPGPPDPALARERVIAISATHLQGIYSDGYTLYRRYEPTAVLGGTIYLYDLRAK